MPREKKYTKTVAVRLTKDEWELIAYALLKHNHKNPSEFMRSALSIKLALIEDELRQDGKKAAAKARREAKKAANVNA